jgi:predicted nucleic acid-binding protein
VPASAEVVYIDSSAFVKLFLPEPDSAALARYLAPRARRVSATLLRTEVLRTAVRAGLAPRRMSLVRELLESVSYLALDRAMGDEAGIARPPELRSLDAVHLASARRLGAHLSALVTYDQRLADAARWHGITVVRPG